MMNEVLQGILQGTQLGMQLRREKLYQEAQQRQQVRLDREDELRDQEFQIRMNQAGARQVDDAGMVTDEIRHDGTTAMPGVIGADMIPAGAVIGNNIRKAAGGQTVRRKNRDGSTVAYKLPTFEQRQERAYKSYADRQEADENARLNRETKAHKAKKQQEADDLSQNGISLAPEVAGLLGVDPSRKFMPAQIDELARAAALMGSMRQKGEKGDEVMSFHDFTDDQGNVITETRYKSGKVEQSKKGRIGKSKNAGGGSGSAGVQERFDETAKRKAQADVDRLQKEEDELHAEKIRLGKTPYVDPKVDKKAAPISSQEQALQAKLEGLDFKIKAKQVAKQRIIDRFNPQAGAATGAGKPTHRFNPKTGQIEPAR